MEHLLSVQEICTRHYIARAKERVGLNTFKAINEAKKALKNTDARILYGGETRKWIGRKMILAKAEKVSIRGRFAFIINGGIVITVIDIPSNIIPENDINCIQQRNDDLFRKLKNIKHMGYTNEKGKELDILMLYRLVGDRLGNCPSKKACVKYILAHHGVDW